MWSPLVELEGSHSSFTMERTRVKTRWHCPVRRSAQSTSRPASTRGKKLQGGVKPTIHSFPNLARGRRGPRARRLTGRVPVDRQTDKTTNIKDKPSAPQYRLTKPCIAQVHGVEQILT